VTDVPDDAVIGRLEDVMQRDRQLDGAEVRRQMAAGLRDRLDDELAQLARQLPEGATVEPAQVGRARDRVEQGKADALNDRAPR
jgi:hypothetical protein